MIVWYYPFLLLISTMVMGVTAIRRSNQVREKYLDYVEEQAHKRQIISDRKKLRTLVAAKISQASTKQVVTKTAVKRKKVVKPVVEPKKVEFEQSEPFYDDTRQE